MLSKLSSDSDNIGRPLKEKSSLPIEMLWSLKRIKTTSSSLKKLSLPGKKKKMDKLMPLSIHLLLRVKKKKMRKAKNQLILNKELLISPT